MQAMRKLFQGLTVTILKLSVRFVPLLKNFSSSGKSLVIKFLQTKRSPAAWFWLAVTYFFVLILMLLLIKIGFSGKYLSELATENGQSVVIHISDGMVEGKPYKNPAAANDSANSVLQPVSTNVEPPAEMLPASKEGLTPMPLASLTEKTDKETLPIIGPDGTMPWKYYARPFQQKDKKPIVALIFTNLGLSKTTTEKALNMSHDFTLAFSPYANDVNKWALKARAEGFETVADLPMQAEDYPLSDPGQFGLLEELSPDLNIARMHAILSRFPGYVGMLGPVSEKMTANKDEIKPYLLELKKRGLLFIYIKNSNNGFLEEWTKLNGFYALGIDTLVDGDPSRTAVDAQLQALADLAKSKGYAIGLVHSYPSTIDALQTWLDTLNTQGVQLAPLSAVGNKILQ